MRKTKSNTAKSGQLIGFCILAVVCVLYSYSVCATEIGKNPRLNSIPGLTISNKSKKEVVVIILDVKGNKFLEKNLGPVQGVIEFEELLDDPLPGGLYILEVRISGEQPIKRLIIY